MISLYQSVLKFLLFNLRALLRNLFSRNVVCKVTDSSCSKDFGSRTINIDNSMWGIDELFTEAKNSEIHFEHGVFFGDFIQDIQRRKHIKKIYTMSPFRKKIIEERIGKECVVVGNFINIADRYDFEKKINRDSVLFFPAHTTLTLRSNENFKKIKSYISEKHPLSKIYISLFYLDYLNEKVRKEVLDNGMIPFSFGSRYDPMFLRRFKGFVSQFKSVYTNDIGTHVGYCLALGKKIRYVGIENKMLIASSNRFNKELSGYKNFGLVEKQKNEVKHILNSDKDIIPLSDEAILNEYFGHKIKYENY